MLRATLTNYSFLRDLIPFTRLGEGDLLRLGVEAVLVPGLTVRGVRDSLFAKTDLYLSVEWAWNGLSSKKDLFEESSKTFL